jgi:hypothetical protein
MQFFYLIHVTAFVIETMNLHNVVLPK